MLSPSFRLIGTVMWSDGLAPSGPNDANAGASAVGPAPAWATHGGTNPAVAGAAVVGGDVVESAGVLVVAGVVPAVVEVVEVSTDDPGPDSLHAAAIAASATADTKRRHATRDRLTT